MKRMVKFFCGLLVLGLALGIGGKAAGGGLYYYKDGHVEPLTWEEWHDRGGWHFGWFGGDRWEPDHLDGMPSVSPAAKDWLDKNEESFRDSVDDVPLSEAERAAIRSVSMDLDSAACVIETGDRLSVATRKARVHVDGSVLKIEAKKPSRPASENPPRVLLTVPQGFRFQEFEIDAGAAAIEIDTISCQEFDLDTGAASVEINSLTAREASLDIGAGWMQAGYLDAQDVGLSCDAGAGDVTLAGRQDDYTLNAECAMGSLTLDGEPFLIGVSDDVSTGHSARNLDAEVGAGTLNLYFAD